jgi:SAM-dependent methyltransferase
METLYRIDAFFTNYINDTLFWVLLFFLLWNGYILLFNRGVPNIRTAPAARKTIIGLLKQDMAKLKGGKPYRIVDMGSGNGLFSRYIARNIKDAQVMGVEIATKSYLWSLMMKRLFNIENLEYHKSDFFEFDVSEVDAVVMYLSAYEMGRMGEKLDKELKSGAMVISNRFKLGSGWEVEDSVDIGKMDFLQKFLHPFQKNVHLYHKS